MIEELIERHWGIRGPFVTRQVRDDPFRRTWWMGSRHGPVMVKWFGDPDERDTVVNSLRIHYWAAQHAAELVQLLPRRDGSVCLDAENGVLALFEYVDGAAGVGEWKALGRGVGHLHTLPMPEFAQRSYFCPGRSIPEAQRQLTMFLAAAPESALADRARDALETLRSLPSFRTFPLGIIHTDIGIAHTLTRRTGEIVFLDTLDIGIGPIAMDFPPIMCEHLSHLDANGRASHLNRAAAREFLLEYERFRRLSSEERRHMLAIHRAYTVCHAARYLDQARRSGVPALRARARRYFQWLDYSEKMVPRDLEPLLDDASTE